MRPGDRSPHSLRGGGEHLCCAGRRHGPALHKRQYSVAARPVRELRGFSRVELQPGEKRTASFDVTPSMLSFVGAEGKRVLEPGRFTVWIGEDSETENRAEFVLNGR